MTLKRACSLLTVKSFSEDERVITGIASTPSPDRDGDILEPEGAEFGSAIPFLWQHDHSRPVGQCTVRGEFNYGVEVRHPQFFAKGEEEQTLNRGLHQRGVNRVILDSRPVHAARPHSEAIRDAQRKKPKVPVHAVLTATNPLIRFIGSDDMTQNRELFQVWLQKLAQWHQTTTPYLFLHTPDIAQAPELVHTLWEDLRKTLPEIGAVPAIPQQSSLF